MAVRVEDLLRETGWLRRLAVSLVGDEAAADDLVQETLIAAWEHPPDGDRPVQPWLRTVLRNAAWMRRRGERRRAEREAASELAPAALDAPDASLGRLEVQRRLAELVLGLDEAVRAVVVLRYVDGLSAAAIARRLGVPAGTVRWRLKQGVDELRDALDRDAGGDRRAWRLALAPAAALPTAGSTSLLGGLIIMNTTVKIAAVAALVVAGIAGAFVATRAEQAAPGAAEPAEQAAMPDTRVDPAEPTPTPAKRAFKRHDPAARARLAQAIATARAARLRARRPAPPTTSAPAPASASAPSELTEPAGDLDKEYIRERVREMLPLIVECYEHELETDPELAGRITVLFTIAGEPEVGGYVETSEIAEDDTTIHSESFRECMRETIYAVEFEPPKNGGTVVVRYPFEFRPDGEDE